MDRVNFFIPAGGEGRRLRPLTDISPKPLLPVRVTEAGYERIIDTPLHIARKLGLFTIVAAHYKSEQVSEFVGNNSDRRVVTDGGIVHIGGSMVQHADLLFSNNPDLIVMVPGDHYLPDTAVARMLEGLNQADADVALLATNNYKYHETYPAFLDRRGILHYAPKTPRCTIGALGTYAFKAEWLKKRLASVPTNESGHCDLTTDVVFGSDQDGHPNLIFSPIADGEYWEDVGTIRRLYDHIRRIHDQNDSQGNIVLGADLDPADFRDSVLYVDATHPGRKLASAFIAKGFHESYD